MSQNSWVFERPLERFLKAGTARKGCWGLCPIGVWRSPETETPQSLWATFSRLWSLSEWRSFFKCLNGISPISVGAHCPLSAHWALSRRVWSVFFTVPISCSWLSPWSQAPAVPGGKSDLLKLKVLSTLNLLQIRKDGLWAWRRWSLKLSELSWTLFSPGPSPIGFLQAGPWAGPSLLPCSPALWSWFCVASSSQDPELHHLTVTTVKAALSLHTPEQFFLVYQYEVKHWASHHQPFDHFCQGVKTDALCKSPGLFVPWCVVSLADIVVDEVLLEDRGIQMWGFFLLSDEGDSATSPSAGL